MQKTVTCSVLGLSIVAGGLAVTAPASAFELRNLANLNYCLGVAAGNVNPGNPIIVWPCNGYSDQQWHDVDFGHGDFKHLVNGSSSQRCLGVAGGGFPWDGTKLVIWNCTQAQDQGWKPVYAGDNFWGKKCYYFANENRPDRVFGVAGGMPSDGQKVITWPYWPYSADQYWCEY